MADSEWMEGRDHHLVKVVLLGDSGVGKTCILQRLFNDKFDEATPATIGCDFKYKRYRFDNLNIGVTLWDTAGLERFQALNANYMRGAQGAIFVFDVTRRETLERLGSVWMPEWHESATFGNAVRLVVGNKIDKGDAREVLPEEGAEFARSMRCMYYETSAKKDTGIYEAVIWGLLAVIIDTPGLLRTHGSEALDIEQASSTREEQNRPGCC